MSKYNERRRRRDIPIRIPEEPEEINETKKANEQLDLRMKKLLNAQKDYQKDTDKRFGEIGSRLTAIEQALGVKKTKTSSTEETRQKDAPKKEPTDNGSKRAREPEKPKIKYNLPDGRQELYVYRDGPDSRWRTECPVRRPSVAILLAGENRHSNVMLYPVMIKNGYIEYALTDKREIAKYFGS